MIRTAAAAVLAAIVLHGAVPASAAPISPVPPGLLPGALPFPVPAVPIPPGVPHIVPTPPGVFKPASIRDISERDIEFEDRDFIELDERDLEDIMERDLDARIIPPPGGPFKFPPFRPPFTGVPPIVPLSNAPRDVEDVLMRSWEDVMARDDVEELAARRLRLGGIGTALGNIGSGLGSAVGQDLSGTIVNDINGLLGRDYDLDDLE